MTLTQDEHKAMIASAEAILIEKCLKVEIILKSGGDIYNHSQPISVAMNNLIAIEHYETGRFDPAEYFNILSPSNIMGSYSNVNTINR